MRGLVAIICCLILGDSVSSSTIPLSKRKNVVIAGGGPAGLLVAHCLLARGDRYNVEIVESREDPRQTVAGPRSYSLGLNIRGQAAINHFDVPKKSPGLWGALTPLGVESDSFFLHIGSRKIHLRKPQKEDSTIAKIETPVEGPEVPPTLLIPRNKLCVGMLQNLENLYAGSGRLTMTFNSRLIGVDLVNQVAEFDEKRFLVEGSLKVNKPYDLIVGADGVTSLLRDAMQAEGELGPVGAFRSESITLPGQYKVMLQVQNIIT